jgi:hypothetical protein
VKWLLVDTAIASFERHATEGGSRGLTKKGINEALDDGGSYRLVRNSFHDIDFGNDFGIYAHVGPDVLHAVDEGVLKDMAIGVLNFILVHYRRVKGVD